MNRLRNEAGLDPISERGIEMLRRTPATHNSPERKRRVWISLQRSAVRNGGRRAGELTGLVLGMVGVAVATTAVAAIGSRWISAVHERAGARAAAMPGAPVPHVRGIAARRIAERAEPPDPGTASTPPEASPRPALGATRRAARLPPARKADRPAPAPAVRSVVLDALVALRRDHDAAQATRLLDGYLADNPHGALHEEALALAIEAADAEHDPARARLFAGAYASAYPTGRFAPFARRHLGEAGGDMPEGLALP